MHKILRRLGLKRKHKPNTADYERIASLINHELDGPGKQLGYRLMWQKLRLLHGIHVPRNTVMTALQVLDPDGAANRRRRKLKRRTYSSHGPNDCWHVDGYDKLKPFGIPIHGCVDGYSRKILWLRYVRSNNDPKSIARLYLNVIRDLQTIPNRLRSDCGSENVDIAAIQGFLRRNHADLRAGLKAHLYGSSHNNQRIEAWWSF